MQTYRLHAYYNVGGSLASRRDGRWGLAQVSATTRGCSHADTLARAMGADGPGVVGGTSGASGLDATIWNAGSIRLPAASNMRWAGVRLLVASATSRMVVSMSKEEAECFLRCGRDDADVSRPDYREAWPNRRLNRIGDINCKPAPDQRKSAAFRVFVVASAKVTARATCRGRCPHSCGNT